MNVAYPDHTHLFFLSYNQLNSECKITQKFIVNVFNDQSLGKYLNALHIVVRFGCWVALDGYMSGRDTDQYFGCWQVVALMALTVCYINELLMLFQWLANGLLWWCSMLGVSIMCLSWDVLISIVWLQIMADNFIPCYNKTIINIPYWYLINVRTPFPSEGKYFIGGY